MLQCFCAKYSAIFVPNKAQIYTIRLVNMPNLRICYDDLALKASAASATTAAGEFVVGNLATNIKSDIWRSTTVATEQFITLDFASDQTANMLALLYTNLSASATVRMLAYAGVCWQ
jgi:hypothetical protein